MALLAKLMGNNNKYALWSVGKQLNKHFSPLTRFKHILRNSANSGYDKSVIWRYRRLNVKGKHIQATYVWIDGTGQHLRLKMRILDAPVDKVEHLPRWQFDGSSTYQASGENSDVILVPCALYRDPFTPYKTHKNIIVMCETYLSETEPAKANKRQACVKALEETVRHEPWFRIEQQYTLFDVRKHPFGLPQSGYRAPQGPYYCSVGANRAFAREIAETHTIACRYAGVEIAGQNVEVLPAQWQYQTGPTAGIKSCDDLWVSRYILERIAEQYGVVVSFDPKPVTGEWSGAGAHINFSTKKMRGECGMAAIKEAVEKLRKKYKENIPVYDSSGAKCNRHRLIGQLATSSIDKCSWNVANRGVSIRIPQLVAMYCKGNLENRRPSANCDPYEVCRILLKTCLLDQPVNINTFKTEKLLTKLPKKC